MALAAEHTRTMVLGTLVAVPSNRIAPVTASAIATINAIAPGRVILGLGTGFTARNTMGLPPVPVATLVEYVGQVRGLLAGEDVLFRVGKVVLAGTNPCQRCVVPTRDTQTGEAWPRFVSTFTQQRQATLPAWAESSRFDHFYRLAVNTRLARGRGGMIHVGDAVEVMAQA